MIGSSRNKNPTMGLCLISLYNLNINEDFKCGNVIITNISQYHAVNPDNTKEINLQESTYTTSWTEKYRVAACLLHWPRGTLVPSDVVHKISWQQSKTQHKCIVYYLSNGLSARFASNISHHVIQGERNVKIKKMDLVWQSHQAIKESVNNST